MRKPEPLVDLVADATFELDKRLEGTEAKLSDPQAEVYPASGVPRVVLSEEQSALRRMLPPRNRWPELEEFGRRLEEFDGRAAALDAEIADAQRQLGDAPSADAHARADWELSGRDGDPPEPTVAGLERKLEDLNHERDAVRLAADRILVERADHVERHRKRLVEPAAREVGHALKRYEQTLAAAEQARAELVELRRTELWARCFPDPAAQVDPGFPNLAGGLHQPVERHLPGLGMRPAGALFAALREDANVIANLRSGQQRALVDQAGTPADVRKDALWQDSDEWRDAERAEKNRLLEDYKREWGRYPA